MEGDCRVYVGNLPPDVRDNEVEDLFYKYGRIRNVTLKTRRGPPFAFVEFDDPRDAADAVHGRNGYNFDGYRLRVEHPRDNRDNRNTFSRPPRQQYNSYSFRHGAPPSRRTEHRIIISGLPPTGSWQDLKDHMREAGDVCYADVNRDGTGIVEFMNRDDMKFAIKNLDDTKFRSHEGESAYIRIRMDEDVPSRRSRSRSYNGRRSPTYSPRPGSPAGSPKNQRRSYSRSPVRSRSP